MGSNFLGSNFLGSNFQVLQALADEVDPTPHTLSQGDGQIDSEEPRPEDPKP
jgi:hypothetical protein